MVIVKLLSRRLYLINMDKLQPLTFMIRLSAVLLKTWQPCKGMDILLGNMVLKVKASV